jgi:hypothetical protein
MLTSLFVLLILPPTQKDAWSLAYRFQPGRTQVYREQIEMTVRGDFLMEGSRSSRLAYRREERCIERREAAFVLELGFSVTDRSDPDVDLLVPIAAFEGKPVTVTVGADGSVSKVECAKRESLQPAQLAYMQNFCRQIYATLPTEPVGLGGTWKNQIVLSLDTPILQKMDQVIDLTYELLGPPGGPDMGDAELRVRGLLRGSLEEGQFGSVLGQIEGTLVLQKATCLELSSEIAYEVQANILLPEGDFFYSTSMRFSRHLLPQTPTQ